MKIIFAVIPCDKPVDTMDIHSCTFQQIRCCLEYVQCFLALTTAIPATVGTVVGINHFVDLFGNVADVPVLMVESSSAHSVLR
jgi:hypothetical protein